MTEAKKTWSSEEVAVMHFLSITKGMQYFKMSVAEIDEVILDTTKLPFVAKLCFEEIDFIDTSYKWYKSIIKNALETIIQTQTENELLWADAYEKYHKD